MRNILTIFLIDWLLKNHVPAQAEREAAAKAAFHLFVFGVYFTPLLGGFLADRFLGKYRTILYISLLYCAGHACLAIFHDDRNGFYAGLVLIALGSGGIKPCVSALVGDQFTAENKQLFLDSEWKISATSDRMGYRLEGPVIKHLHGHNIVSDGTVSGSITGTHMDFTIRWDSGPRGHYTGDIGADGFAHGNTNDEAHPGSKASWDANVPLGCATAPAHAPAQAPAPAPAPAQGPAGPAQPPTVTVSVDVDVYNIPDGDHGKKLGILRKGSQVQVLDRQNGFAHVKGGAVPTGIGYAWGDFIPSA